jgi:hypothetical protein
MDFRVLLDIFDLFNVESISNRALLGGWILIGYASCVMNEVNRLRDGSAAAKSGDKSSGDTKAPSMHAMTDELRKMKGMRGDVVGDVFDASYVNNVK